MARKAKRKAKPAGKAKAKKAANPIALYYWPTPNGFKISIMLEECKLAYTMVPVNISKGEQFNPDFLKISPNNRMPAIVDPDGPGGKPISIFESGAILQYLGRKTGKFYPHEERARTEVEQWLFWQMGGLGPMAGQNHHFSQYAPEKINYAIDRYVKETNRLYGVLNKRLADREFIHLNDLRVFNDQVLNGDHFLCASERQKDLFVGSRSLWRLALYETLLTIDLATPGLTIDTAGYTDIPLHIPEIRLKDIRRSIDAINSTAKP